MSSGGIELANNPTDDYTGFWRNANRQYHPRLASVVFHGCDSNGAPS